jgi:hypothetical protein
VLFDRNGVRLDLPHERNLWESRGEDGTPESIVAPEDPARYHIDPLTFLETASA